MLTSIMDDMKKKTEERNISSVKLLNCNHSVNILVLGGILGKFEQLLCIQSQQNPVVNLDVFMFSQIQHLF